jgi:hypothetical protein
MVVGRAALISRKEATFLGITPNRHYLGQWYQVFLCVSTLKDVDLTKKDAAFRQIVYPVASDQQ